MSGRAARRIEGRTIITGRLILRTPAHFGNGDTVGVSDMPLLVDPRDGVTPLLTGASIAGALRSYLRDVENGYGQKSRRGDLAEQLFGCIDDADSRAEMSVQSWLLLDDSLGEAVGTELRDGVALDPATRTSAEHKKYDIELLAAGTAFPLRFEFLETAQTRALLPALAAALQALANGEIGLGQRKRRGLGRCCVEEWRVRRYDFRSGKQLVAWLEDDRAGEARGENIFSLLGVSPTVADRRTWFRIDAEFVLPASLLIRSHSAAPGSPDMVHLRSRREGRDVPVLSGTSLAGTVRARSLRIANTVLERPAGESLVDGMFGCMYEEAPAGRTARLNAAGRPQPMSSRVITEESIVEDGHDLVQSRVKIDRFTGGAFPAALFSEQPVFGGESTRLKLELTLRCPQDAEIGLLLLVLKDLWTGDLPLGGESSVGRGRLRGLSATLALHRDGSDTVWTLCKAATEASGETAAALDFEPANAAETLNKYAEALWQARLGAERRLK